MKDTISLVEIASAVNIDPSTARTKLRRRYSAKADVPRPLPKAKGAATRRWVFRRADRSAIKQALLN